MRLEDVRPLDKTSVEELVLLTGQVKKQVSDIENNAPVCTTQLPIMTFQILIAMWAVFCSSFSNFIAKIPVNLLFPQKLI